MVQKALRWVVIEYTLNPRGFLHVTNLWTQVNNVIGLSSSLSNKINKKRKLILCSYSSYFIIRFLSICYHCFAVSFSWSLFTCRSHRVLCLNFLSRFNALVTVVVLLLFVSLLHYCSLFLLFVFPYWVVPFFLFFHIGFWLPLFFFSLDMSWVALALCWKKRKREREIAK